MEQENQQISECKMDAYSKLLKSLKDDDLLKQQRQNTWYSIAFYGCACIAIIAGIWFIVNGSYGGILLLVLSVISWLIARFLKSTAHDLNVEIARRGLKNQIKIPAKKLIIIGLVIALLGIIIFSGGDSGSSSSGSGSGGGSGGVVCPKCGTGYRANHSSGQYIRKYGHCFRCD